MQQHHLSVLDLVTRLAPEGGAVEQVSLERLASWEHPGHVTALQARAPSRPSFSPDRHGSHKHARIPWNPVGNPVEVSENLELRMERFCGSEARAQWPGSCVGLQDELGPSPIE